MFINKIGIGLKLSFLFLFPLFLAFLSAKNEENKDSITSECTSNTENNSKKSTSKKNWRKLALVRKLALNKNPAFNNQQINHKLLELAKDSSSISEDIKTRAWKRAMTKIKKNRDEATSTLLNSDSNDMYFDDELTSSSDAYFQLQENYEDFADSIQECIDGLEEIESLDYLDYLEALAEELSENEHKTYPSGPMFKDIDTLLSMDVPSEPPSMQYDYEL